MQAITEREVHTQVAPSGVLVISVVPFVEPVWWDSPWLHWIWSYCSWGTTILDGYGIKGPKRWFKSWGERPLP